MKWLFLIGLLFLTACEDDCLKYEKMQVPMYIKVGNVMVPMMTTREVCVQYKDEN